VEEDRKEGGCNLTLELCQSLFMAMPMGFGYLRILEDPSGRPVDLEYVQCNQAFADICSRNLSQIVGRRCTDVFPEVAADLLPRWLDLFPRICREGKPHAMEYYCAGVQRWLTMNAFSIEERCVAVFLSDRSSQRSRQAKEEESKELLELEVASRTMRLEQANQALREEVEQRERIDRELQLFRTLVDQSNDALLIVEPESARILDVNLRTCNLLGVARQDLLRLRAFDLDPALVDMDGWARIVARLRSDGRRLRETRLRHKDGSLVPVEISARYVRGTPHDYVVSLARDARERIQQEEEYRTVLRTAMDGFAIVDSLGRFLDVNEAYCKLLGYSREELLSMNLKQVELDPPDGCRRTDLGCSTDQGYERFESLHRTRDGSSRWLEVSVTHLKRPRGRFFMFFRDVTERRRTDQELDNKVRELARSNAALEQFAYAASHDLQEPIRTINSFVQLLARKCSGLLDEASREYMRHITESAVWMKTLVDDLLEFGRVDATMRSYVPIDCGLIVKQVTHSISDSIRETGAHIVVRRLPIVSGDPVQIHQLFLNLIANALKFRSDRLPEIVVSARRQGTEYVFSVQDNGIGIEKQFLERIFVLFQRLHPRGRYPGTGIGLPLCKRIVESHGGRIWAESVPGEGSTFRFTLPSHSLTPVEEVQ